jgi:hypothetical protein
MNEPGRDPSGASRSRKGQCPGTEEPGHWARRLVKAPTRGGVVWWVSLEIVAGAGFEPAASGV